MSALQITVHEHDEGTVLLLDGEIDIATEDDFRGAITHAVAQHPNGRVVLDCARLSFIDSSGLRVLIQCHKAARENDGNLLIATPSERVTHILRVTAIDTRIPVHATVEEALGAMVEPSRR